MGYSAGVIDMLSDSQPLLSTPAHASATAAAAAAAATASASAPDGIAGSRQPGRPGSVVVLQFPRRLAALMELLRPYPALALSLLAVAEALVVAQGAAAKGALSDCHFSWMLV